MNEIEWLGMLEGVFGWLLAASWQASVLALLVLALQALLRGRLNPRWRYALWLLVVLRLILPVLPESALSLFQFAPTPAPALLRPVTEPLFTPIAPTSPAITAPSTEPDRPLTVYSLLALGWLAGVLVLFGLTWEANRRFARQVARSPGITDPLLLDLFLAAKAELGVRRSIRLVENQQVQSPAIMGLFSPTLLLPTGVRDRFDATELRLIFLHELAHLKRGDVIVQGLIALLQILHWFNPVLWFAFRRMRLDREPATDALVLSRAGEGEKERYGLMLIKLLEHFNQRHSLPTLVGILEDKDQFKRRFSLIARFTRGAYGWSLLGVLLIAVLAVACLTKFRAADSAASTPHVWPPADLNKTIGFTALEATGEINPPTDPAINAAIDNLKLTTLGLPTLPLHLYLDEMAKVLKEQNPDSEQISFVLMCPAEDQPYPISFHLQHPSTLREIMAQLNAQYPLRYQIRGATDIIVWQVSHFETDFKKQAAKTTIDLNLDHATLADALKAVQAAAAAKRFIFDISNFDDTQLFPADAPHNITLQQHQISLDQALRYILLTSKTRLVYELYGAGKKYTIEPALPDFATEPLATDATQPTPDLSEARFDELHENLLFKNLKVKDMPLDQFIQKISRELAAMDPQKQGLKFVLTIPPGEAPIPISLDLTKTPGLKANVFTVMYYLKYDRYPIRYKQDDTTYYIEQLSKDEVAFDKKADSTHIDLDFNNTDAVTALPPGPTEAEMKAEDDSLTPLMKALESRQYDQARTLLAQGADCNATDKMGSVALAFLIDYSGNDGRFPIDILQTMLSRTRDPNPPVTIGFSTPPASDPLLEVALMGAAYSNGPELIADHRQVVKLLMAHGARFAGASDDIQALLQAAALDDLPALQQLVAKGTSPSATDGDGWTPLLVSIALENNDVTNWLIDHGANVSAITRRGADDPLLYATAHGDDALVEKLIAKGAKPVLRGGDLWRAIDRNDQRLFDDLINAGADPKREGWGYGSSGGKSWRQISSDSLFICIAKGQTAMALTLIDKGVDPEPKNVRGNQNFAYWAVYHDRPEILQALLDHGANPLLKDDAGETPLSLAQKSHPDLVPMLQAAAQKIAPKSDTSTQPPAATSADEAAFYQALKQDRTLEADTSINSSTHEADAQMLLAIQKGDVAAVKKVLEHAVDPNTFDPDRFFSCPVYWAVHFNQPEILKLLLEHFATGDIGPAHESPLQLAQRTHPDLVPIIEEGIKRNRALLTARLTEKLHSIHIDLPAFSGAPLSQVTKFLLDDATAKVGYLERRVNIGTMDLPPSTTITSPAKPNIPIWDALQTIADANKLRFDVDGSWPGDITLYPPRDEAVIHPPTGKSEAPSPAPEKTDAATNVTDASLLKDPAVAQVLVKTALQGDTAAFERLPKLEAKLNVASFGPDTGLMSPLAAATHSGQVSDAEVHPIIAPFLWGRGNRVASPLLFAISREASIEDIARLLSQGSPADPPQDEMMTPLGAAAMAGNMDAVKLLIAHGADVNKGGVSHPKAPLYRMTPLIMAASEGQDEIVMYLLQHGATPVPAAICAAAWNSYPYEGQRSKDHFEKTVQILIDAGALKTVTPDWAGSILAAPIGTRQGPPNAAVLKMLLDAGISPESPMPFIVENGEKPNSVIGYYRELYQKNKDDPVYADKAAALKPLLDMLEAADKGASANPNPSSPADRTSTGV